ncbi:MAG: DUF1697 domain-containing protein [Acidimicrobiales bacterium]
MARLVALFRGINVGGHNRLPMAPLRDRSRRWVVADVTIIQSGNVCFSTGDTDLDQLARTIRAAVAAEFAVDVPVLLRSTASVRAAVDAHPFDLNTVEPKFTT